MSAGPGSPPGWPSSPSLAAAVQSAPGVTPGVSKRAAHGAVSAANVLFLPIFLVLLVFFIVLVAQSKPKSERVAAVRASVEKHFPAFTIDRRLQGGDEALASRSGTVFAVERLTSVGDLFAAAIAVSRVTTVTPGRLMEVRFPTDTLFQPDSTEILPERAHLMDRVVAALLSEMPGARLEVEALLSIDDESLSQRPGPVQRAAAFGRALTDLGAPVPVVSVGVERGEPGAARLLFTIRDLDEREQPVSGGLGLGGEMRR